MGESSRSEINRHVIDSQKGEQGFQIEDLKPGDTIRFSNFTQLAEFEDMIASAVEPKHDPDLWAARPKVSDLIRPPKFNGTIAEVELTVMDDPYARLLDAPERGWKSGVGRGATVGKQMELRPENAEQYAAQYKGFRLSADARSTGRGSIGRIEAEMWYAPIIPKGKDKTNYRQYRNHFGDTVRRIITKPKLEAENFEAYHEQSRKIGFEQLRKGMMHPLSTPMRD